MINSINIDIGGTFTDCYIIRNGQVWSGKVETTPEDLTVGFRRVIEDCAETFGISMQDLLKDIGIIRYGTTLATNALINRRGPKMGLLCTAGYEDTIHIGRGSVWYEALPPELARNVPKLKRPEPLVSREMIVGIRERIDCFGNIVISLSREEVQEKLRNLVDKGAEFFVVSYLWSFVNPAHEQMTKEIIEEEYPSSCLGSCPVFLSSDIMPKKNEYERTMTTVLSAYLHPSLVEEITNLGSELGSKGYDKPLFLTHNTGGCAPISRTSAVKTYNAGPVACITGCAHIGKVYDSDVIMTDMGGTSFDIGVAVGGEVGFYKFRPLIDWWKVGLSMIETRSIGAGGGSIAWINKVLGTLEVGPQSAGSLPGPVCYEKGGEEPTVTDADLVLGYLDPNYYLAGRMKLNKEKARKAIEEKIARPLNIDVGEAALAVKRIVDANMGNEIFKETSLKGYDPREFIILSSGGAGPAHCCGYGEYTGAKKIIVFPFSSVFSAFGVSVMDILQIYEKTNLLVLYDPISDSYFSEYAEFNDTVKLLQEEAIRDIRGGGLDPANASFFLELEMRYGQQPHITRVNSPKLFLNSEEDVNTLIAAFTLRYGQLYSPAAAYPQGGVEIFNFILRSVIPSPKREFPSFESKGEDTKKALKGRREVYWEKVGFKPTNIYELDLLECGNTVEGPSIIEAKDTTVVLPEGNRFTIDRYLNCVIEKLS